LNLKLHYHVHKGLPLIPIKSKSLCNIS